MYKFYKDKNENFECNIGLEGASLSNAQARLILENEEFNLIFEGNIDKNGKCVVPIKKLKILTEGLTGTLKLEVIVDDDTYFLPFQDQFTIGVDKKITVEALGQTVKSDKKVIVEVKEQNNISNVVNEMYDRFQSKNINIRNIKKYPNTISNISQEIIKKYKLQDKELKIIQENLLKKLIIDY
jgi:hypothetical protein